MQSYILVIFFIPLKLYNYDLDILGVIEHHGLLFSGPLFWYVSPMAAVRSIFPKY